MDNASNGASINVIEQGKTQMCGEGDFGTLKKTIQLTYIFVYFYEYTKSRKRNLKRYPKALQKRNIIKNDQWAWPTIRRLHHSGRVESNQRGDISGSCLETDMDDQ